MNSFYNHGSFPISNSSITSAPMRAELDLIAAGFDKLPTLSGNGNKLPKINVGGTAMTLSIISDDGSTATVSGALTVTGSSTINGTSIPASKTLVTTVDAQTLTNKTLTAPVISTISNTGTLTLPTSTDTLVGRATTDTLTNKTIALGSNTVSGTLAQFNTALTDGDFASLAGSETLTNKTISGANNTLTNIGNASLTNSSLTIGSTNIALGATSTTLAGLTSVSSTSFTGALTGNASTATALQTARTIWGQSFDGTANVTGALTGVSDITASGSVTLNAGTANGVLYLNGSKVVTSGSALTFDGTALTNSGSSVDVIAFRVENLTAAGSNIVNKRLNLYMGGSSGSGVSGWANAGIVEATSTGGLVLSAYDGPMIFDVGITRTEQMRLTSTGLDVKGKLGVGYSDFSGLPTNGAAFAGSVGIGTSSPGAKLHVTESNGAGSTQLGTSAGVNQYQYINFGGASGGEYGWQIGRSSNTSGLGGNSAFYFYDIKASATRMSIDASGNLGLGVTPSAWGASFKAAQVGTGAVYSTATGNNASLSSNTYHTGVLVKYVTDGNATQYSQLSGQHQWFTAPSGTAGNPISFTQAMTLTSGALLQVAYPGNTSYYAQLDASDGNGHVRAPISGMALVFDVSGSERARIDSSGNLLVGGTTTSYDTTSVFIARADGRIAASTFGAAAAGVFNKTSSSGGDQIYFQAAGVTKGSVVSSSTATTYNTSSDYRLKNITGPITNSGQYIDSLKPVEGTWKADGSTFVGLIAHEVQEVSRTQVATGEKDGEQMQGMDYSSAEIIANLIAELQSVRRRLAALEAQ